MESSIICPVCTLFLRPGITLKNHLGTHPKQKVIEALVKITGTDISEDNSNFQQPEIICPSTSSQSLNSSSNPSSWNVGNVQGVPQIMPPIQGNHVFIYQQSMSTSQTNTTALNPLTQQYIIPAVLNHPQTMAPPYVYQQQQLIMSSGSCNLPQMRFSSPFELTCPPGVLGAGQAPPSVLAPKTMVIEEIENEEREKEEVDEDHNVANDTNNVMMTIEHGTNVEEIREVDKEDCGEKDEADGAADVFNDSGVFSQDKTTSEIGNSENSLLLLQADETRSNSQWNASNSSEELSKACQTASSSSENVENFEKKEEYYYFSNESENAINYSSDVQMETLYDQANGGALYHGAQHHHQHVLQSAEHLDYVEVDGVQVIIGNYATAAGSAPAMSASASQGVVLSSGRLDKMDAVDMADDGGMVIDGCEQKGNFAIVDNEGVEMMSRGGAEEHVDIQADERMPPRGELSGQESMGGASEINWVRLQYNEGSSSASCASLSKAAWDDSSDLDQDLSQHHVVDQNHLLREAPSTDRVLVVQSTSSNFACSKCDETFPNLLQLKEHASDEHPKVEQEQEHLPEQQVPSSADEKPRGGAAIVGDQIGKRKVKKLVLKLKKEKDVNYDTVFTNKIKMENGGGGAAGGVGKKEDDDNCKTESKEEVGENNGGGDPRTVCGVCNEVLADAKSLRQHKAEAHRFATPQSRFKCATCDETFPNEYKYTDHLKVHPLECKLCGKLFYRRQNIQLHMKRHLGIKPFKCDVCEKAFSTKQKLEEHRNVHTGNAPLKCAFCDETFKRHSNLVAHRHRHHLKTKKQVKDYVCHCGEYFHSRKKLAWHKEVHDAKPKACTMCSEKFVHLASLTRHIRKAHNERYLPTDERSNNDNVECPVCKGVFIKSSLELHMRTHNGSRPYSCLICNKDFTTRWNLKLHKWTHASRLSKPFRCDQCNGAFVRETDYVSHMNSHKSIKPYTCNHCGARFIRKYNCQRHVKEHENDKKFSCTVCSKTFHRSYYLQDHMRIHSGVRPFTCHVCGKSSTTKSNHNKHIQIHHAREPVNTEN